MRRRYASIDIGTNTVLLLVAEQRAEGDFAPVLERAEITRLGRGVDQTGLLSAEAMEDTLRVLADFAQQAKALGAAEIAVSATSAVRDAKNGTEFLQAARRLADVLPEIISGDREGELTFKAVFHDFGRGSAKRPLLVIDIGGGSTEFVYGAPDGTEQIAFRRSFEVGSVRMTERYLHADPIADAERLALVDYLRGALELPAPSPSFRLVGVAGTVTTLYAVQNQIEPYDSSRVHGRTLSRAQLRELSERLGGMPLAKRRALPGLDPKRADVICAGAVILEVAMDLLHSEECLVSDRGLRWGLLFDRFGAAR